MSADEETIAAYETRSHAYLDTLGDEAQPGYAEFLAALPHGAHVLDLGCGPGDTARRLQEAGHRVDAVDATPAMVARARESGVAARVGTFDEIDGQDLYDGIWANFSLLHAPRGEMPRLLARLHRALKPGGRFHIALKLGEGERRDRLRRYYTYYSEAELIGLLEAAGFAPTIRRHTRGKGLDGVMSNSIWIQADG